MVKLKTKVNVKDLKENKEKVIWAIIILVSFSFFALTLLHNFLMAQPETPTLPTEELNQQLKTTINDSNITQEQSQENPYESIFKLMINSFPIWFGIFLIWKVFDRWDRW
jgi:hypothetical protein